MEEQQEVSWHIAQIMSRLDWDTKRLKNIFERLKAFLTHKSNILKVHALESLTILGENDDEMLENAIIIIVYQMEIGSSTVKYCRNV